MELKSIIEKIMLITDDLKYSDNTERLINKEYLLKDDSQTLKELEKLLNDSIKYAQSQELKMGLEIILLLISHKNENVRNSTLAKMFVLMDDGLIRELVVKELKNGSTTGDRDSSESAEYSLDLIADEIHRFEVMDAVFDMFCKIKNRIIFKVNHSELLSDFSIYSSNKYDSDMSQTSVKNNIFYKNALFNRLICKIRALNRKMDEMIPYLEEMEDYDKRGYGKLCLDAQNSRSSERESLQKLADFYTSTFTEKGHLRRLIFLLDDEDQEVQQIGFNALTEIVETLLTGSAEKRPIKPVTSSDLEEISSFKN